MPCLIHQAMTVIVFKMRLGFLFWYKINKSTFLYQMKTAQNQGIAKRVSWYSSIPLVQPSTKCKKAQGGEAVRLLPESHPLYHVDITMRPTFQLSYAVDVWQEAQFFHLPQQVTEADLFHFLQHLLKDRWLHHWIFPLSERCTLQLVELDRSNLAILRCWHEKKLHFQKITSPSCSLV